MKRLRILTRVYDRESGTYIQRCLTYDLNAQQVDLFQQLMMSIEETTGRMSPDIHGFGAWDKETKTELNIDGHCQFDPECDDRENRDECRPLYHKIKTPNGTENRFMVLNDFHLVDTETKEENFGFKDW